MRFDGILGISHSSSVVIKLIVKSVSFNCDTLSTRFIFLPYTTILAQEHGDIAPCSYTEYILSKLSISFLILSRIVSVSTSMSLIFSIAHFTIKYGLFLIYDHRFLPHSTYKNHLQKFDKSNYKLYYFLIHPHFSYEL